MSEPSPLLYACAIVRSFDRALLVALGASDEAALDALLAGDQVVALADGARFELRPEPRSAALSQLRAQAPETELTLQTRAFELLRAQAVAATEPELRRLARDEAFFHLRQLFFLLLPRLEWVTIQRYAAAARELASPERRHAHELALYEGYAAVRTQRYEQGGALLDWLLAQPELEPEIACHALNALAQMYRNQTQYDRALAVFARLRAVAETTGSRAFEGVALINMSAVHNELEQYDIALDYALQSLEIFRERDERVREAYALHSVGLNAMYLGRWQFAQDYFGAATAQFEALRLDAGLANLYWGQGFLAHLLGDAAASEAAYRRALALAQSDEHGDPLLAMDTALHLGLLLHSQSLFDQALAYYDHAMMLALQLRYQHRVAIVQYQRGRIYEARRQPRQAFGAYAAAIDSIETLRGGTASEAIKVGLLGTTQQIYEAMVLLCIAQERVADAFNYVERARSRAFLDTLVERSPELYDAFEQPVVTLAEVQRQLPADALMLEYFTTGVEPRGEHLSNRLPAANERLREHLLQPARTVLFAVTRDTVEIHQVKVDPNTLRPQLYDRGPGRRLLSGRLPTYLYERLLGPVEPLLRACRTLLLVPHGPLHFVPFQALRSPLGVALVAPDGPVVALAPSATILLRNCLGRPTRPAGPVAAFGYNDTGADALLYAEIEARGVARLMRGAAHTGAAPKWAALDAASRQARWIHIAGHALYDPQDPLASALRLGADETLSARAIMRDLELVGDGVTLSGCTTGLSHVVPGDELFGLQRAFLYAGAPTVICTLWEASDLVALLVMERFYLALARGRSPGVALRDAQVAVREMTGHALLQVIERWRSEYPQEVELLDSAVQLYAESGPERPFAEPLFWAPFMLIGRP